MLWATVERDAATILERPPRSVRSGGGQGSIAGHVANGAGHGPTAGVINRPAAGPG